MKKRIKTKSISDILVLVIHCTEQQDMLDGADGERKEVSYIGWGRWGQKRG